MEGYRYGNLTPTEFIENVLVLLRKEFNPDYVSINPVYHYTLTKSGYKQDKSLINEIRIWFKTRNGDTFYHGYIGVNEIYDNFYRFTSPIYPLVEEQYVIKYKHFIQDIWNGIILNHKE